MHDLRILRVTHYAGDTHDTYARNADEPQAIIRETFRAIACDALDLVAEPLFDPSMVDLREVLQDALDLHRATHSETISDGEAWKIADAMRRKYSTGFLHGEAGRYLCKVGDPLRDDRAVCDASEVVG